MKRSLVLPIAACALLLAGQSLAGQGAGPARTWNTIQRKLSYRLYQPGKTLGFKLTRLRTASCGKGKEPWVEAMYGTYNGVLGSQTKGFALYEGHPICSDPGESTRCCGLLRILGVFEPLSVYCDVGEHCTGADGFKNGWTIQWNQKRSKPYKETTSMQFDTSHLTFEQLVKIATSLKKVR